MLLKAKRTRNGISQTRGEELIDRRLQKADALEGPADIKYLHGVILKIGGKHSLLRLHALFPTARGSSAVDAGGGKLGTSGEQGWRPQRLPSCSPVLPALASAHVSSVAERPCVGYPSLLSLARIAFDGKTPFVNRRS